MIDKEQKPTHEARRQDESRNRSDSPLKREKRRRKNVIIIPAATGERNDGSQRKYKEKN